MTGTSAAAQHAWEKEGQRLAPLLDDVNAVVIAGADPIAAAAMAIGIARVHGVGRRVAVADLVGEVPPLQALVSADDPHGISDSFLYGVSLNKIAQAVNESGNVFVMPSGTEAVALGAVYANDRWRRLAAGFHQVGALLLVVAVPGTPGFAELCGYIGAVMPVGEPAFPLPTGVPVIAPPAPPLPPPPPPDPESTARARAAATDNSDQRRTKLIASLVALGAVAVAVGAFWPQIRAQLPASVQTMLSRAAPDSSTMVVPPTPMDSTSPDSLLASASRDGLSPDGMVVAPAVVPVSAPLVVVNGADSASAARYAIYVATANTREAAMPDDRVRTLAAVAMSPVPEGTEPWFRVTVGAATTRAAAEALLARMRSENVVGSGSILSVPYALRLESGVAAGAMADKIADFTQRGLMVYALQQADGSATVYTGAFETPVQASTLADSLRALGITPVLAYRTGRMF